MTMSAPLRWYWRVYIPLVAVTLAAFIATALGPTTEARVHPVRGPDQKIVVIERSASRICWAWTFTKLRDVASDNIDAYLIINDEPGGVANVFDMDSGRPWGLARYAVPVSDKPYTLHWCASLQPYIKATDAVRVTQVAYYPGFLHLWRLPVMFPDVISPGIPRV